MNKNILNCLLFLFTTPFFSQVGIGTTNPDSSSILHLESSDKGLLIPRVSNTNSITNPVDGLMVFDTTENCIKVYSSGTWNCLSAGSGQSNSEIVSDCNTNGFEGNYVSSHALSNTYFSLTVTNNAFSTANFNVASSDLTLSGVSGVSVGTVSLTAGGGSISSVSINSGESKLIYYQIHGTPASQGTLTGSWSKLGLSCSATVQVTLGGATFSKNGTHYIFSVNDPGNSVVEQGTLLTGVDTVTMDYTSGLGTYNAYTSPDIAIDAQYCEDGASDWTFAYSYSGGTFSATGSITVTLITKKAGVQTDWPAKRVLDVSVINFDCVTVPWVVNNVTDTYNITIDEGGDAIRGALSTGGCASCTAYDAASENQWVACTVSEYNQLKLLNGAYQAPMTDTSMNAALTGGGNGWGGLNYTWLINNGKNINGNTTRTLPPNSYIYAFRAKVDSGPGIGGAILVISPGVTGTLTTYGGTFPAQTSNGDVYYVMKRPNIQSPASTRHIGCDNNGQGEFSYHQPGFDSTMYWNSSGTYSGLSSNGSYTSVIQTLSSTNKQW